MSRGAYKTYLEWKKHAEPSRYGKMVQMMLDEHGLDDTMRMTTLSRQTLRSLVTGNVQNPNVEIGLSILDAYIEWFDVDEELAELPVVNRLLTTRAFREEE